MKTQEQRAEWAAYMRDYTANNKERINADRKERRETIKETAPAEYERRLAMSRERNSRYAEQGGARVRALRKENQAKNYTYEKGVAKREKYRFEYSTKVSLKSAKKRAEEYGLPFDLTPEWFENLFSKGCAATGLPLDKNGSKTPFTVNIDRIIPANGYVQSNCRLVCSCFNKAKWNWTDADVEKMARAFVAKLDA